MSLGCKLGFHDYETVGRSHSIAKCWQWGDDYKYFVPKQSCKEGGFIEFPKKKVCLRCNKCVDEADEWMRAYQEQEIQKQKESKRMQDRKSLAKKMWEDCND